VINEKEEKQNKIPAVNKLRKTIQEIVPNMYTMYKILLFVQKFQTIYEKIGQRSKIITK